MTHSISTPISNPEEVVSAINFGGEQYIATDGINYQADTLTLSAYKGEVDKVYGSQDSKLYKTYREGNFHYETSIKNGVYDIIFKFSEPKDMPVGERIFNVLAQNNIVIEQLDIRQSRDGKIQSALVRAVYDVVVENGNLIIDLSAIKGMPVISAMVIKRKHQAEQKGKKWQLVWQDEFNYQGLPAADKWNIVQWPARKVNDEDQTYTNSLDNLSVKDGLLHITAMHEPDGLSSTNKAQYSSGRINSRGKGDFLYGRAEIRAKLPAGQGTWSAIWMLPSDPYKYATHCLENEDWQGSSTCDAWPNSGEIDIMEHVGFDMQTIHGTVHNKAYYWVNWEQRKSSIEGKDVDQEFHVYSVEWTPENITVYFDDTPYFSYQNEHNGWQSWPYDHPYHLILNLAIGGMWGKSGGPIDNTLFPATMLVDYVRIYKRKDNNLSKEFNNF